MLPKLLLYRTDVISIKTNLFTSLSHENPSAAEVGLEWGNIDKQVLGLGLGLEKNPDKNDIKKQVAARHFDLYAASNCAISIKKN